MAIYLKSSKLSGNTSTSGYENWVNCHTIEFNGISSTVSQTIGNDMDRVIQHPNFGAIRLTKSLDKSSIALFEFAHSRQVIPEVDIHYVTTTDPSFTFAKLKLNDVIISHFSEYYGDGDQHKPSEQVMLSYTRIEKTYIPQKVDGSAGSPIISGYDLTQGQAL
jgi:type VI secretion system secreted protein Hcp